MTDDRGRAADADPARPGVGGLGLHDLGDELARSRSDRRCGRCCSRLAFGSLVLSLAIPEAFTSRGWALAGAYAAMHIGRSIFAVIAFRDDLSLRRNYERILCWCIVSSALALVGAAVDGHAREVLWAIAVTVDVLGGVTGFYTPGLGRSPTSEWTIDGGHLAERCHAFVLIALGESIVVLGATLVRSRPHRRRARSWCSSSASSA